MVRHGIEIIRKVTNRLNPGQTTVITGDQPVYAIGKQVQWRYKEEYKNVFWMMGPLHIEMLFLNCIGDWLKGSGWCEVYEASQVATPGKIDSFLKGSHPKRSRYAHEVTLSVLQTMARESFENQKEFDCFKNWKDNLMKVSSNAYYWFTVIDLEIALFMFVKSLRESNFDLFVRCITYLVPWTFALDHVHYSRWMSVFLYDLTCLPIEHEDVFNQFMNGNFTIKKSNHVFSNMGIDQAHEQNNKMVKIDGGAIGILENDDALLDWAIAGPQIAEILNSYYEQNDEKFRKHHENTDAYEKMFYKNTQNVLTTFLKYGNPFEECEHNIVNVVTRVIFSEEATMSVRNAAEIGIRESLQFKEERLVTNKVSLYDHIKQNNLPLFHPEKIGSNSKLKKSIQLLKEDRQLFSNLYISCQTREGDLDNFFAHENHAYPVSLSDDGKLKQAKNKSEFLDCLDDIVKPHYNPPVVDAIAIDGPALVHMNAPVKSVKSYGDYCDHQIVNKLLTLSGVVCRLDIVFDVYRSLSIKQQTREDRSTGGIKVSIQKDTPIQHDKFKNIITVGQNKTSLFKMIADAVVSNKTLNLSALQPCNQEEADTRLFLHVMNASHNGLKKIMIITVDTDVVVIAIFAFSLLDIEELWIEFGSGKNKRWLPIHQYAEILGNPICQALPFWHALTGCDTVSRFANCGKMTAWKTWLAYPEATQCFTKLLSLTELTSDDMDIIQRFVVLLYDRTSSKMGVNECRKELFTKKSRSIENIPPTENALEQHVKRAMLQSYIWTCCLSLNLPDINYNFWGWINKDGNLLPQWITIPEASKACYELKHCGCLKQCSGRCTCRKNGLNCTQLCKCDGGCYRI